MSYISSPVDKHCNFSRFKIQNWFSLLTVFGTFLESALSGKIRCVFFLVQLAESLLQTQADLLRKWWKALLSSSSSFLLFLSPPNVSSELLMRWCQASNLTQTQVKSLLPIDACTYLARVIKRALKVYFFLKFDLGANE